MPESQVSARPVMHWVPVVDAQGRTGLQAVWSTDPHAHAGAHAA
jgi:hypothetical protein